MSLSPYIIVFIAQGGELEIKSLLLAYSLRENLPRGQRMLAAIPSNPGAEISESCLKIFSKLSIEIHHFKNEFIDRRHSESPGDWMSNKFESLLSLQTDENILFLDSDIILLKKELSFLQGKIKLAAKPADVRTRLDWKKLYQLAGLPMPREEIATTVDLESGPPYFNTGVLFLHKDIQQKICKSWKRYFMLLSHTDTKEALDFDYFHRDQLAFSLAIQKNDLEVSPLEEVHNYPIRHRKIIHEKAVFIHYHDPGTLAENPELYDYLIRLHKNNPSFGRILRKSLSWYLTLVRAPVLIRISLIFVRNYARIRKILRSANH
ncbi:MAG: hypothetical protein JW801_16985 [Bacteroidales bacterium]|nr:hypothetical protein [Bacteroidales bacterium]